jgi:hypothetical protein
MHGDDLRCLKEVAHGLGRMGRVHRVVTPDGKHHQIRFVQFTDEFHVGKYTRIAGMIDFETIFQFDDVACPHQVASLKRPNDGCKTTFCGHVEIGFAQLFCGYPMTL